MQPLNNLDVVILIITAISAIIALCRGLVKEVLSIVGWIVASITVFYLLPILTPFAKNYIASSIMASIVTALIILLVFYIVWLLSTDKLIGKIRVSKLSALDRVLGLLFGIVRACLIVILFNILISWALPEEKQEGLFKDSRYFQLAGEFAKPIEGLIPDETKDLLKNKKDDKAPDMIWGMSGKIAHDLLTGLNLLTINKKDEHDKGQNRLQYELYGLNMVQDLFGGYYELTPSQVVLFLNTLLCDDILDSIDITWDPTFSIDNLSEGEKQLILSVGLSLVLNQSNILFLLDEPDVSLHPKWQQDFITNFTKGLNNESMAVITTHSPSLASDLSGKNLTLIRKGRVVTKSFKYYGKRIDDILYDYFGLESTRNKDVSRRIEELWNMIQANTYNSNEFITLKEELSKIIGNDDSEIMAMNRDILRKTNEKNK